VVGFLLLAKIITQVIWKETVSQMWPVGRRLDTPALPLLNLQEFPASFIHFRTRFCSAEGRMGSTSRRTRNTSRFSAICNSSTGSTTRWDQARSEV